MSDITSDPVFDAIFDFNERVVKVEEAPLNTLSDKQHEWTLKAYREEITEFVQARDKQDIIGMVDASLDLVYFAVGTLKKMGLSREQAFAIMMVIHRKNMKKERGKTGTRGDHEEDAVKPEGFVGPEEEIGHILFGQ